MIIFKDIFSEDELFSDTYPFERIHDGCVLKVKGKFITQTTGVDDALLGANPSADNTEDEGVDESSVSGIDVVLAHRLVETNFGKKDFVTYIKEYTKRVKTKLEELNPDDAVTFKKGAEAFVKAVLGELKEYQFFLGESMNAEAQVCLVKWEDEVPYLYFFKHGLIEEKV